MTRRRARLLTLLGVLLAVAGLAGYWLTNDVDRTELTADQRRLLGITPDEFHVSFVVAGRDIDFAVTSADPVYDSNGNIINWIWRGSKSAGLRTDTIIFVTISGDEITMITIPRDTYVADENRKINSIYGKYGAEGLRSRVEALLGVPVDYYAVINLDIFQDLVDALGGVTVDVPYRMLYHDNAGGLHIDFKPGPQHMDGEDVSNFVRYRETARSDFDRMDNVKRLAYSMIARLKELNVRAVTTIPTVIDTFFKDVETNGSIGLARELATRLPRMTLTTAATLPVADEAYREGPGSVQILDPVQVNRFIATMFGGEARQFAAAPELTLLVTDRSDLEGAADWYVQQLIKFGVPEDDILLQEDAPLDGSPTRLLADLEHWTDADYFVELLGVGKQQIDRLGTYQRRAYQLELVIGPDAAEHAARAPRTLAAVTTESP